MQVLIDAVQDERTALAKRSSYGSIAESMLIESRKPEPYGGNYYRRTAMSAIHRLRPIALSIKSRLGR